MTQFLYLSDDFMVYMSILPPEKNEDLYICELSPADPEDLENTINLCQSVVEVSQMLMGKKMTTRKLDPKLN